MSTPAGTATSPSPGAAWRIARELLEAARPVDRRVRPQRWSRDDFTGIDDRRMRLDAWGAAVPGSGAWDAMWPAAVASCAERGFDVAAAEALLVPGLARRADGDDDALLALDAEFRSRLLSAVSSPAVAVPPRPEAEEALPARRSVDDAVHDGWVGQVAGAAFGTPLEGCTGRAIAEVYGPVLDGYPGWPDTLNDDIVYEIVALDALEEHGRGTTARHVGEAWRQGVPFGWSAEWVALDNLRAGIEAPRSGVWANPFSDWIGAQMRGMVFGLLAPGRPLTARHWAALDASVSHDADGAAGAMWSAMICALSFADLSVREVLHRAAALVPAGRTRRVLDRSLRVCATAEDASAAWAVLDAELIRFGWVHTFPNAAAVTVALWFHGDRMTPALAELARCGLDVDCNAGLVGTVCGIRHPVARDWSAPLDGRCDTYLARHPVVRFDELAGRTLTVARLLA